MCLFMHNYTTVCKLFLVITIVIFNNLPFLYVDSTLPNIMLYAKCAEISFP